MAKSTQDFWNQLQVQGIPQTTLRLDNLLKKKNKTHGNLSYWWSYLLQGKDTNEDQTKGRIWEGSKHRASGCPLPVSPSRESLSRRVVLGTPATSYMKFYYMCRSVKPLQLGYTTVPSPPNSFRFSLCSHTLLILPLATSNPFSIIIILSPWGSM